jgi:hypothetical protein
MKKLEKVKSNSQILNFIQQTEKALKALGYNDHGLEHSKIVMERALKISKEIKLSQEDQELAAIASFCHDMGNFLNRKLHNHLSALLFHQVFQDKLGAEEVARIMQAISYHDSKNGMTFCDTISAVTVIADKSDVRRSRVLEKDMKKIKKDIHYRVNYATEKSELNINKKKKTLTLKLKIDTSFVPVIEYFEIFTRRMVYCRKAANYLGYHFGLIINDFKLL